MCGIAGIISSNQNIIHPSLLQRMANVLAHRGPDGEGYWINHSNTIGLAHRRLAIIDLSDAAAQPMHYASRYSITYNGEIYNYIELRKHLQNAGYTFHTKSDTEVILAAYDLYKEKCLQFFDGMFAFAIWDEKQQQLFAARDRLGEKPFYYYKEEDLFVFASEMKALWAVGIPKLAENKMLLNYLTLGYVQNPADKSQTFYSNIFSLMPSHYLLLDARNTKMNIVNYWDIDKQTTLLIPENEILQEFNKLFNDSVSKRLRSDVPIGASLSGGLDSSSIAYSIVQQMKKNNGSQKFKTFSAVFPGFEKDEQVYIKKVARQFSFENYTVTPTADGLINDFEKLCYHQEEPFPSSSIYAQYKVFELASQHQVKVMLDGQGADEILAGYHRYLHWYIQELVSRNKFSLAKKERQLFRRHHMPMKWGIHNWLAAFLPSHVSIALEQKEFKRIVHHPDISKKLMSSILGREWDGIHKPIVTKLNDILYFSTMENGLEELLRFSDRNSMAHGTEVRLPFLNTELVQFIFSLPSGYKISNGYTKYILRKLMDGKLPDSIVWRTDKIGYEPPQQQWMQNERLIDYIHEAKKKLVHADLLKPQVLQKKIIPLPAHESNNNDWRYLCTARILQ
jgi:asparagine synthase (glutamine-hydrolysing)